ncbi:anchored repeat ABC transporter, substrate-binding protein [Actinotalea sp. K2]|uniref:anchored repeat ABC transporter, substrate-binding protein n=1 Tax=Actinotalea sp. K2 TaxID=2939438 RepID=UPI002017A3D6|nr:anchored repeat ABC transporter, substrate-binding protein [Actinotalea sp. K2]MCL3863258.1 anchored repeat ABC transporter, substrate-binding protein [Actinotalea sp. K2]
MSGAVLVSSAVLTACAPAVGGDDGTTSVVTTTPVLADLARNVAGDHARVVSIVPDGGDPHSYEPSLRDVRDIAYADVAFSNYVLLEDHAIIKALDANLPAGSPNVALAEAAVKYAAEIIPLVENVNLDTIWLGLRVTGSGVEWGATRASEVRLSATRVDGPGQLTGYLTETFGNPRVYFDSAAGFDPADPSAQSVTLPTDAHTHMSWTFEEPGVYELTLGAQLWTTPDDPPVDLGTGTFTFAVGVDPHTVPGKDGAVVLDGGHGDIAVDLSTGALAVVMDSHHAGESHQHVHRAADVVVSVPNKALAPVPVGPGFRFLGRPDHQIYQLPQAVLGKHVHGEIDPHLWHDVRNAEAYVRIIRDTLIGVDPEHAAAYRANATAYLEELHATDDYVARTIGSIPRSRRYLVTTHDAFAYLGAAYDVEIAGFVTPNPATEPSLAERQRLSETIRNLHVPAVFLEPHLAQRSTVLQEVAREHGIDVCDIYSDTFSTEVSTYVELMRFNADSLRSCLT